MNYTHLSNALFNVFFFHVLRYFPPPFSLHPLLEKKIINVVFLLEKGVGKLTFTHEHPLFLDHLPQQPHIPASGFLDQLTLQNNLIHGGKLLSGSQYSDGHILPEDTFECFAK